MVISYKWRENIAKFRNTFSWNIIQLRRFFGSTFVCFLELYLCSVAEIKRPFVNLGIGTSALELEMKLTLDLILQASLFPVLQGLWIPNLAGW